MTTMNCEDTIAIDIIRLSRSDPYFGTPRNCFVCTTLHPVACAACIQIGDDVVTVALCEGCVVTSGSDHAVLRKFLDAPDMVVIKADDNC